MKNFWKKLKPILITIGSTLLSVILFGIFIFIYINKKKTIKKETNTHEEQIDNGDGSFVTNDDIISSFDAWKRKITGK